MVINFYNYYDRLQFAMYLNAVDSSSTVSQKQAVYVKIGLFIAVSVNLIALMLKFLSIMVYLESREIRGNKFAQ